MQPNQEKVLLIMCEITLKNNPMNNQSSVTLLSVCQTCHLAAQQVQALCPIPMVPVSLVHLKNTDMMNLLSSKLEQNLCYINFVGASIFCKCCCGFYLVKIVTVSVHLGSR